MSFSVHLLAKRRKPLPNTGVAQKLHMHDTTCTHNENRLLPLDTGIHCHLTAAGNQMGNSHSSSALSHIPTPASLQTPRLASQLTGKWTKEPNPPSCHPATDAIPPGEDWAIFVVERSREQWGFRCCSWKAMTTFALYTGKFWDQCWQPGSDWKLSS